MFLRRMFGILARMAKLDGRIDEDEVRAAKGAFGRFPDALARRKFCIGVFNSAKNGRKSLDELAGEFEALATPLECLSLYELLWDIACASGVLLAVHKAALRDVCAPLGLPPEYFRVFYRRRRATFREGSASGDDTRRKTDSREESRRQESSRRQGRSEQRKEPPPHQKTPFEAACELLGCSVTDSVEKLRCAYREAAKRYHPDILRAKGLPEEQVKEASELMAAINAAWELICHERNL